MTYNEALLRAKNFGSGLVELGSVPGSFVCIYSQNRVEWILCEQVMSFCLTGSDLFKIICIFQGCYNHSLVVVPLYDVSLFEFT